jgi:hypothetical protein
LLIKLLTEKSIFPSVVYPEHEEKGVADVQKHKSADEVKSPQK